MLIMSNLKEHGHNYAYARRHCVRAQVALASLLSLDSVQT